MLRLVLAFALILLSNQAPAQTVVGHTAGQFRVNESGAATYTVPIAVPPGTAGVEPQLSLFYSSQARNGSAGVGWSLTGLSVISRCPATQAQDSFTDGVDFDADDRFCLDGERMMAVGGIYGEDATEYRTEQNSFRRAISYGVAGTGPEHFTVQTKTGLILEYGATEDARIEAQGRDDVLFWAVSRIRDTVGNALTVSYAEDQQTGAYRPTRIEYTSNEAAELAPFASVIFTYEPRPDVQTLFLAGATRSITHRLSRIESLDGEQVYRSYLLAYDTTVATGRSRLASLTECGSDGTCFAPTVFGWDDLDIPVEYGETAGAPTHVGSGVTAARRDIGRLRFGDFNGDGRTDIYRVNGYGGSAIDDLHLAQEDGGFMRVDGPNTFVAGTSGGAPVDISRVKTGDFNGDGLTDIYRVNGSHAFAVDDVYLFAADGTFSRVDGMNSYVNGNLSYASVDLARFKFGDFNGDGRTDIYHVNGWQTTSTDVIKLSQGDGTWADLAALDTWVTGEPGRASVDVARIKLGDFNGDGLTDIYRVLGGHEFAVDDLYFTQADGTFVRHDGLNTYVNGNTSYALVDIERVKLADFNGDGNTDIYYVSGWETITVDDLHLGDGAGGFTRIDGLSTFVSSHYPMNTLNLFRFADFNGDGLTDIYYITPWGDLIDDLYLSKAGDGFQRIEGVLTPVSQNPDGQFGAVDISRVQLTDFDGNGIPEIYRINGYGGADLDSIYHPQIKSDSLMRSVQTGHGRLTEIDYAPLTDDAVYTKDDTAEYPLRDFQAAMQVVSEYRISNGIGGMSRYNLSYVGAKLNLHGRGFRGFLSTTTTDHQTGISGTVFYERDYRCISSKVERTEQRQSDGSLLSEVDNEIAIQDHGFGVHFSFVETSTAKQYDLDGTLLSTVTTNTEYADSNGNVTELSIDYGDGQTELTVNSYDDNEEDWLLGRLTRSEVTKTSPQGSVQTRVTSFEYDPVSGILTDEVIEPDDPLLRLTREFQHTEHGNVEISSTEGPAITTRQQQTFYDSQGRYVTGSINALGHTDSRQYDLGNRVSQTGPNQLTTTWTYDGFGRLEEEIRPDGTSTATFYESCDVSCPEHAVYRVRVVTTGAPEQITYFDLLDREIREEVEGFDGTRICRDTEYNLRGLVHRVSEPYFEGNAPLWTSYNYDLLGRVTEEVAPGSRVTSYDYDGFVTTVTNPLQQQSIRTEDLRGQLVASEDAVGNAVLFRYDAFGNLVEIEDPLGHLTEISYDIRGNRTSITTPDSGTTTFTPNALGQVVSQTDANGNSTTFGYDLLGRRTLALGPEGAASWTYDSAANGIGNLASRSFGGFSETYQYDDLSRPSATATQIDGSTYSRSFFYDLEGRPEIVIYPGGLGVRTAYNARGYETELRRLSDNALLWRADSLNARGQATDFTYGNGVTTSRDFDPETGNLREVESDVHHYAFSFDPIGNLEVRRDERRGLVEGFSYDNLNRLTGSEVNGQPGIAIQYDALGNITYRSDIGTYAYGENGAGPHAVTSITGGFNNQYRYDAAGNLVWRQDSRAFSGLIFADGFESGDLSAWQNGESDTAGPVATTITYSSFHKPLSITQGDIALTFAYGPDRQRYRQARTVAGQTTVKHYVGGVFEREETDGAIVDRLYLQAGGNAVAVYTATATSSEMRYLHRDHLGSVVAISGENGQLLEALAFDPWGARRNPHTWEREEEALTPTLDRGFTGHEHLDAVTLIHMGGRVYDPVIGRFLSPDPFVQAPELPQNLNRYSYVLNNPLSLTDPSGFFFKSIVKFFENLLSNDIVRLGISIGVGLLTGGLSTPATILDAVVSGAGFGFGQAFSSALLSGGDFGVALQAGLTGAIWGGLNAGLTFGIVDPTHGLGGFFGLDHVTTSENLGRKIIAHGTVQGSLRTAQGGKFEHGFLAGAFGELGVYGGEHVGGTSGAALGGILAAGTAAELGGGKFANGALSAVFIETYNHPGLLLLAARLVIRAAPVVWRFSARQFQKNGAVFRSKSAREMAGDLAKKIGRNTVKTQAPGKRIHYDLKGASHFDKTVRRNIPTPHVHTRSLHVGPNGRINAGDLTTRAATRSDIRIARELARRQGLL